MSDCFLSTLTGECLVLLLPNILHPSRSSPHCGNSLCCYLIISFIYQPHPGGGFQTIFFWFHQTARDRCICSQRLMTPHRCELAVIFQTLAYVSPHDCFLMLHGDGPFLGLDSDTDGCTGSCWLELCNNPISRDQWCRTQCSIVELWDTTQCRLGIPIHLPFMYQPSHSAPYLLSMQVGIRSDTRAWVSCPLFILSSFL